MDYKESVRTGVRTLGREASRESVPHKPSRRLDDSHKLSRCHRDSRTLSVPKKLACEVGPLQQDGECFGEGSLSVCGYAVYIPGWETPVYIDLVSTNISHTAEVSTHNLRRVVERLASDPLTKEAFAKADTLRVPENPATRLNTQREKRPCRSLREVWSDCGLHFRTQAVAKYPTQPRCLHAKAALSMKVQRLG